MASAAAQNQTDMALSHQPAPALYEMDEKKAYEQRHSVDAAVEEFELDLEGEEPTEEELNTLPRVSGAIPWVAYTIAFVELCERFGYYGCQVLCMFPSMFYSSTRSDNLKTNTGLRHQLRPASSP